MHASVESIAKPPAVLTGLARPRVVVAAILLAITAAGATARAWQLNDRPLWEDEAYTWQHCQVPYYKLLLWKHDPAHGPLSHLLVRHSMQLFGTDEVWALRLPSLLCGILCIPAAFWLGRTLDGDRLGLLAAACVAVDPNMVDQSQQARMYTMLALASLLALVQAIRLLRNPTTRRRDWMVLGVLLSVQFATNYGAIVLWIALAVPPALVLLRRYVGQVFEPRGAVLVRGMLTAYGTALLLSCRGLWKMLQFIRADRHISSATVAEKLQAVYEGSERLIANGHFALVVVALALFGLWLLGRRGRMPVLILSTTAVVGLLMIYSGRSVHHMIAVRYFTIIQPTLWIGLSAAVILAPRWQVRAVLAAGFSCVLALQFWQATHLDHWADLNTWRFMRTAAQFVQESRQADELFTCTPYINFGSVARYYDLIGPADDRLQRRLSEPAGLPSEIDERGTWLIAYGYHPRVPDELRALLRRARVQERWGVEIETLVAHVKAQGLAVVRVAPESFDCWVYDSSRDRLRHVPPLMTQTGALPSATRR